MKIASTLILAAVATLAQATDAPCTNEACTSLCNATPSCMSTLFEPETAQCYTFSCVLNNYSRPSKYLGYEKPGATYPCPADQPIPGEPQTPPAAQPTANVEVPAPEPTTAAPNNPAPTTADSTPGKGEPSSLTTAARPPATDGSGSPTTGSQSSPTGSTGGGSGGGSGSGDAGSGEGSDPAAPTIVLDGSAIKAMAPGSLFVAIGLAMVLF